jgi:DNA-binding NtrC family response regulator
MDETKSLQEMRKDHIVQALRAAGGDMELAAEILVISTLELKRLVRAYGLTKEKNRHDSD